MSAALLRLDGLEVHAGARRLLGPLSLALEAGQCLGLVGESGSGKSLTGLALLGLLPPGLRATGRLQYRGRDVALDGAAHRALRGRGIGWVPQDPLASLHPLRTVGAQLVETLTAVRALARRDAHAQARELLARVQLPQPELALRRHPHQFSGGQRQRIAIALALAAGPQLLVADEPTSALDARIARDILDLLERLRREDGLALLLISHDLPLVGAYAQHVQVLKAGAAIEHGATAALFARPAHAYTRELLQADHLPALVPAPAAPAPRAPLLQASALRVRYRGATADALDGVAIELHRGEGLALVGESGSGKSTLGRVVLQLLRGASGRVRFDGEDVTAMNRAALRRWRAKVGVVFQDPAASLDPRLRVVDIVGEPLRIHGLGDARARRAKAAQLMAAVGLSAEMLDRHPHQFSGGQRQRIAIARALATDPALLVCDEAVSALDAHHRAAVLALLAQLKRERGLALLFATHDLAAAAAVAERIAVLEGGRIVESGATGEVLRAPRHPHTQALVAARRLETTAAEPA